MQTLHCSVTFDICTPLIPENLTIWSWHPIKKWGKFLLSSFKPVHFCLRGIDQLCPKGI